MTFKEFEDWAKEHKYFSYVFIVLFCLGIAGQILGYWEKLIETLTPDGYFEISQYEISIENSVYYEWDNLPEKSKVGARKTQFPDIKYRQFRYDEGFVDEFGAHPARGIVTAALMIQYASAKMDLSDNVESMFLRYSKDYSQWSQDDKSEFKEYFYELVPKRRFVYEAGTNSLIPFVQGNEAKHQMLIKAMHSYRDNPEPFSFVFNGKVVKTSTVDNLVLEHLALFSGSFLPVFEVYVRNPSKTAVVIDKVAAEVIEIVEYLGGAESVPSSKIITIPVAHKIGMNERKLIGSEEVYLKPGADVKMLLRLEPSEKLSSYLIKLHLYAGDVHQETDVFALDM